MRQNSSRSCPDIGAVNSPQLDCDTSPLLKNGFLTAAASVVTKVNALKQLFDQLPVRSTASRSAFLSEREAELEEISSLR